ncbi:MAG: 3-oxoacyl-[acyl-carrier-protein] reductase [Smithellaceae bacterium]|nr:3-oxoacyl-[acyl-carrier-protein] reductase [Smithellaceae bacterium]
MKVEALAGKTALVTGASRGIGRAIAVKLAENGAFVYINYAANHKAAAETLKMIEKTPGKGALLSFDVADLSAVQKAFKEIISTRERLDILVNNAGLSIDGLTVRVREEDFDRLCRTNLKGTFNCCQAATRPMMKQRGGRIINVTSVVALAGNAGQAAYAATKAGIVGLTKSLARELGARNICVNAVAPGFIETDMTSAISAEQKEKVREQIPLSRLGTTEDVAAVVAFLTTEEAAYITGQVVGVNGGLYM